MDTAWHDLCDWYIEISKLDHSDYTDKVLLYSVSTILKILHPFVPFVTEKLWMLLNFEDFLISSNYPEKMNL
ncbi:MAG: class I tRNA ligase family protein [Patescibacteria group bacterium]